MAEWKNEELASFSYHLKKMLESDLSLINSLTMLQSQRILPQKKGQSLIDAILQGESLSTGVRIIGMPLIFCAFIEAAEYHGNLCSALSQCHQYFQLRAIWLRRIKQVTFYPLFIFCFLCLGLLFLSIVVLPTFAELYQSFSLQLPWTTRFVFTISNVLPYFFILVLIVVSGFIFARRTQIFADWLSRLPIVTSYYRYRYTQYLSLQLGSFLTAGVPMLTAFTLLESVTPWRPLCQYLSEVKEHLVAGATLSNIVQNSSDKLLPVFAQTVTLGEETGRLGEMLAQLAITTEEWLTEQLEKWMTYLEPLLTLTMGCIMAIVVISLFLPMFGLIQAIQ